MTMPRIQRSYVVSTGVNFRLDDGTLDKFNVQSAV